jgi:hypothetical protein
VTANGKRTVHAYTHPGTFRVTVTAEGLDGLAVHKVTSLQVTGHISSDFKLPANRRYVESESLGTAKVRQRSGPSR